MNQDLIIQLLKETKLSEAELALKEMQNLDSNMDCRYLLMLLRAHQGAYQEAVDLGRTLYQENQNDATLRFYLARIELALGNWTTSLQLFDSIRGVGPFGGPFLTGKKPLWNGQALDGKTLFIATEGGLGDAVCFARFATKFAQMGARVILGTYPAFFSLFEKIPGVAALVDRESHEHVHFDYWIPALSCPRLLKLDYEEIDPKPYLSITPSEKWRSLTQSEKIKVAIVHRGNPNFAEDYLRSLQLDQFNPLLQMSEFDFYSPLLTAQEAAELRIRGVSEHILNPNDLAQFLSCMDFVISVDTGSAHLAGALGVPTILLNRKMGWFTFGWQPDTKNPQKTPFYDSFEIFHQETWGKWEDVIERVKNHLRLKKRDSRISTSQIYHPDSPQPSLNPCQMVETWMGSVLTLTNDYFVGKALWQYGEFSMGEVDLFRKFIREGDTVVEAGAHLGAHTLAFAQLVGEQGKVIAFEPQQFLAKINRTTLNLNNIVNTVVHQQGLSDQISEMKVSSWDYNKIGNFGAVDLRNSNDTSVKESLRLVTLDSLNLDQVHFIKFDIEGMEFQALMGAEKTIQKYRPLLYIENDRPENSEKMKELLQKWNYEFYLHNPFLFNPRNFKKNPVNIYGDMSSFNLFAFPKEKPRDISQIERLIDHG